MLWVLVVLMLVMWQATKCDGNVSSSYGNGGVMEVVVNVIKSLLVIEKNWISKKSTPMDQEMTTSLEPNFFLVIWLSFIISTGHSLFPAVIHHFCLSFGVTAHHSCLPLSWTQ